jgi:DNA-binding Lrp family transcriptional regulator
MIPPCLTFRLVRLLTLDGLDRQIIHALIIDGRLPFSRIAAVVGVSEQTVARRYRRMRSAVTLRVVGVSESQRPGQADWHVRLQCVPDAAAGVADALARRPDTSWVRLTSGGTEIVCAVKSAGGQSRHDLLLRQLPSSRRIVAISAHSILHVFRGGAENWSGATRELTREQAAALSRAALPQAAGGPSQQPVPEIGPDDQVLFAELARDGRASYSELAHAIHWHESTVRRRIEELRATGILYFDVDVDTDAFGYRTEAQLWMSVAPARLAAVGSALAQHVEIPFAAATTGASNLMASVICEDDEALYRYLTERIASLDGVNAVEIAPIIRTVKRAATILPRPGRAA